MQQMPGRDAYLDGLLGAANAQYSFILALGLSISDLRSINFHCSGPKAALIQINFLQALG